MSTLNLWRVCQLWLLLCSVFGLCTALLFLRLMTSWPLQSSPSRSCPAFLRSSSQSCPVFQSSQSRSRPAFEPYPSGLPEVFESDPSGLPEIFEPVLSSLSVASSTASQAQAFTPACAYVLSCYIFMKPQHLDSLLSLDYSTIHFTLFKCKNCIGV